MPNSKIEDIKVFAGVGMDLDSDERLLSKNSTREVYNSRLITSDSDNAGSLENIKGNIEKSNILPSGNNVVIQSTNQLDDNAVYYFVYNSNSDHSIFRYNVDDESFDKILYGESALNFSWEYRVNSANVLGGYLYWVDDNQPRCLNIEKAYNYTNGLGSSNLDGYVAITEQILRVIKYPPAYEPAIAYASDANYKSNFLRTKLWQVKYRYVYDNNERSVFSSISEVGLPENDESSLLGNQPDDLTVNNRLDITFNTGTREVHAIEIAVREGNIGVWRLAKVFDRYDSDGAFTYDSSNVQLSPDAERVFYFYNDTSGTILDQEDAARKQDYVPLKAKTQEIIDKNRIVYGNCTEEFDKVDIDVQLYKETNERYFDIGEELGYSFYWDHQEFSGDYIMLYHTMEIPLTDYAGAYQMDQDMFPPPQGTGNSYSIRKDIYDTMTVGEARNAIVAYYKTRFPAQVLHGEYIDTCISDSVNDNVFYVLYRAVWDNGSASPDYNYNAHTFRLTKYNSLNKYTTWKSHAWHEFGLVYSDEAGRNSMVNVSEDSKIYIPHYINGAGGSKLLYTNDLKWEINHIPPSWATSFQWVYAPKTSVRWFQYFNIGYNDLNFSSGTQVDITVNDNLIAARDENKNIILPQYQDYQKGDKLIFIGERGDEVNGKVYLYDEPIEFEIRGYEYDADTSVNKITVQYFDESILPRTYSLQYVVEIYRPNVYDTETEEDKLFYEISEKYPITSSAHEAGYGESGGSPGSWARDQIVTGGVSIQSSRGTFKRGDCYLMNRYGYEYAFVVESDSWSDYYTSNYTSIGRVHVQNSDIKQSQVETMLRFGGLLIEQSQINDICKFEAENYEILQEKFGEINCIRELGIVLKVLQGSKVTSIYLNRSSMQQAQYEGQDIILGSTKVLGYISPSISKYGCENPESVVISGSHMFFVDARQQMIIRDAPNGMVPISNYGVKNYIKTLLREMKSDSGYVRINGYYDNEYDELGYTFLNEYTAITDSHKATLAFKDNPTNRWTSFFTHYVSGATDASPEHYESIGTRLYSFKDGEMYEHNVGNYGEFYGVAHDQEINIVSNLNPQLIKTYNSISLTSNIDWDVSGNKICEVYIDPDTTYPTGMYSYLMSSQFRDEEGELWAAFMKDMYTGADVTAPVADLGMMFNGRDLRGKSMVIKLVNDNSEKTVLFMIKVRSTISKI